jgi:hypothetical protein
MDFRGDAHRLEGPDVSLTSTKIANSISKNASKQEPSRMNEIGIPKEPIEIYWGSVEEALKDFPLLVIYS